MMQAITTRRTNRRPFLDAPVPEADRARLSGAVDVVGGRLVQLTDPKLLIEFRDFTFTVNRDFALLAAH